MFFGWNNIKKVIKDLYATLSAHKSYLSSKRLERFVFTIAVLAMELGAFVFFIHKGTLTSTDVVMLITPLLLAAGYNMSQTEKAKKDKNEPEA